MQLPLPHPGRDAPRAAAGRGELRRSERRPRAARRARFRGLQAVLAADRGGSAQDRLPRGPHVRDGDGRRQASRSRRDELRLRRRVDGKRGRGRRDARRRARARAEDAAPRRLHLRRRPHAGGLPLAHADGEDERRVRAAARGGNARRLPAHRPDLRRRQRLLRDPRRRPARGAELLHRLRRPQGDRADDPPAAAGGLPDGGVSPRPRDARPGRAAREPPGRAPQAARAPHAPGRRPPRDRGRRSGHRPGGSCPSAPRGTPSSWHATSSVRTRSSTSATSSTTSRSSTATGSSTRTRPSSAASGGSATSQWSSSATRRATRRAR